MTVDPDTDKEAALAALRQVHYPGRSRDIVSFGLVPHVAACDGLVRLTLAIAHLDDERQQAAAARPPASTIRPRPPRSIAWPRRFWKPRRNAPPMRTPAARRAIGAEI